MLALGLAFAGLSQGCSKPALEPDAKPRPTQGDKAAQAMPTEASPEREAPVGWPKGVALSFELQALSEPQGELDPFSFQAEGALEQVRTTLEAELGVRGRMELQTIDEGLFRALVWPDKGVDARWALSLRVYGEGQTRGVWQPLLQRTPVPGPGACVPIPETELTIIEHRSGHGFDDYLGRQIDVEQDYRFRLAPTWSVDVDLDGELDVLVPIDTGNPHLCPGKVEYALYLSRGSCGHLLGTIAGRPEARRRSPGTRLQGGLIELHTTDEADDPSEAAIDYSYRFDGTQYVQSRREERESRCSVHPADCDPLISARCRREPSGARAP